MTARERKVVAETLREWAAWCEANPKQEWSRAWIELGRKYALAGTTRIASSWCDYDPDDWTSGWHTGPTAATGLLLAAAMVEAGDSCD